MKEEKGVGEETVHQHTLTPAQTQARCSPTWKALTSLLSEVPPSALGSRCSTDQVWSLELSALCRSGLDFLPSGYDTLVLPVSLY